ncbi:MAG: glycoside hydrolase family 43 protein, partial [Kiritimatiellae bacterium]|nr:glycoside hydrolase family 43 protein [Kiritimatiellia bacterium]
MQSTYRNPIIPGFHPDPSVCRVGENFYLVTSTFEYFPGVPVFHSRDLVNWRQIGHCLTRPSQLPLENARSSEGIYAPTIRYHDGTFFMVTTNVSAKGNFYVTANDPGGPWSEPVWVEQGGIDPSFFFDDDGRVYLSSTGPGDNRDGGIILSEIDVSTGKLLAGPRLIWTGTGGQYPEASHLYRINGLYYLMIAEGGTDFGHMVTIARSSTPWGPFEGCPRNPILTHRSTSSPIQNTGHADLVQASNGAWWLVFLGVRPNWIWHHLGRETFLAPVMWDDNGWPLVGRHGMAALEMEAECLPRQPWPQAPARDDFDASVLAPHWNFLRDPREGDWSLAERAGWLCLRGSAVGLDDVGSPAFVGRRQQHFDCRVAACLDFHPLVDGEEAGLVARMNEAHHYEIAVTLFNGERCAIVRRRIGSLSAVVARRPIEEGVVIMAVEADRDEYRFLCGSEQEEPRLLARGETRYLSKEVAGGFTGAYLAMYATGNGK